MSHFNITASGTTAQAPRHRGGSVFGDIVGIFEDIAGRIETREARELEQARQDALLGVQQGGVQLGRERLEFDIQDARQRSKEAGFQFDVTTEATAERETERIRQFEESLATQREQFAVTHGLSVEELDLRTQDFLLKQTADALDRDERTRRRIVLQDAARNMNDPNLTPEERNAAAAIYASEEGSAAFLDQDDPRETQQALQVLLEGVRGEASSAAIDAFRELSIGVGPDGSGIPGPIPGAGVGIDWSQSYQENRIKLQDGIDREVTRLMATPTILESGQDEGIIRSAVTAEFERQFNNIRKALIEDAQIRGEVGNFTVDPGVLDRLTGGPVDPNAAAKRQPDADQFASQLPAATPGSTAEAQQISSIVDGFMRFTFPERFLGA